MSIRDQALAPNRKITEQTFALAWNLLLKKGEGHNATDDERCRAKCWLTYRAVDGMISFQDWREKVSPAIPDPHEMELAEPRKARWLASQRSAEVYLDILCTEIGAQEGGRLAEVAAREIKERCLRDHCPAVQNYLRLTVIAAHAAMMNGKHALAAGQVMAAIDTWRGVMSTFNWQRHPFRWTEAQDDCFVLQAMTMIWQQCTEGRVKTASFMSPLILRRQQEHLAWMKCLVRMGGLWTDEYED